MIRLLRSAGTAVSEQMPRSTSSSSPRRGREISGHHPAGGERLERVLDDLLDTRKVTYSRNQRNRSTPGSGEPPEPSHFPNEQAAFKHLYLVVPSLDPTGKASWMNRWKPALYAFVFTFEGRIFPTER